MHLRDCSDLEFDEIQISGNSVQKKTITDNNVFDGKLESGTYNYETGEKANSTTSMRSTNRIDIEGLTQLSLVEQSNTEFVAGVRFYSDDGVYIGRTTVNNSSVFNTNNSLDTTKMVKYMAFAITSSTDANLKFAVNKNASLNYEEFIPNSPSIEYPSKRQPCGNDVNIFDKTTIKINKILNNDGSISASNYNTFVTDYIEVTEKDYTISGMPSLTSEFPLSGTQGIWKIAFYNENKEFISITSNQNKDSSTFKINQNCKYIVFGNYSQFESLEVLTSFINNNKIKLQKGTVATAYSPFRTRKY